MNGIAGIVYPDVFQVNHMIFPMLEVMEPEKPEKKDIHTYNNIQIGSCGNKLAVNEKKTVIGGFDGTIYNLLELHEELVNHGYHFLTKDATEVLVHAYELWGTKFIERIDGDFAIMILDPKKNKILLARDRIGKIPLFWYHSNNHFLFGSQIKSLLSTGIVPQAPATDALASYFFFGYIPQDVTPITNVNKLLPGHILQYNFTGSKTIESYWSYSSYFQNTLRKHPNTLSKLLNHELERATKNQLPQSNSVGCFISGGLGSASTAYYLKKVAKEKEIRAFSVGFEEENSEDLKIAKEVANHLQIPLKMQEIKQNSFLQDFEKIIWHLDEPISDPTVIATWALAKLASNDVTTAFSGMGCDELLAGHSRYTLKETRTNIISHFMELSKPLIYKFLVPIVNLLQKPLAYRLLKKSRTDPWQFEYLKQNALFSESMIKKVSPKLSGLFDPEVFLHKFHHINRVESSVASFLYFDVKTRLADHYVVQYDRLTKAHNVAWRTPYLDHHLIEFVASLPEPNQLTEGETASYLKLLMKNHLPSSIIERPKKTRKNFLERWVTSQEFQNVFILLKEGTLVETGIISKEWLIQSISTHESRVKNFRYIWAIYTLEVWFQLFINRPITPWAPDQSLQIGKSKFNNEVLLSE